jgi:AmmeMemoRadiSam system protein A
LRDEERSASGGGAGLRFDAQERRTLLDVARASIEHGLHHGGPRPVDPAAYPAPLQRPAASFVTLRRAGELRGCIGELEALRALVESVAHNAWRAAFHDPRFDPVGEDELGALDLHLSVLGGLEPLPAATEAELLAALRPGRDGLLLDDGAHRATFLPAVWASLPEAERFVAELKRKAGLRHGWPVGMRAWRYGVTEIST